MSTAIYVVHVQNHWKIEVGKLTLGPFGSRAAATEVSLDLARAAAQNGRECRVIAQAPEAGVWDTLWPANSDRETSTDDHGRQRG